MNSKSKEVLYVKYKDLIYESGGELFIPFSLAIKFIDDCRSNKLAIIGIENFSIDEDGINPLLGHIADYSSVESSNDWENKVEKCYNLSAQFITSTKPTENFFLNFVLASEDES